MKATLPDVLRSIAFYCAFFPGTAVFVVTTPLAALIGEKTLIAHVGRWSRYHRLCARVLLRIDLRVEGSLPEGPMLVALKHESMYEAIDLPALLGKPAPFPKVELVGIPGFGGAMRRYGVVVVERGEGAKALRAMVADSRRFVAQGRPLAIFPEGTRVAAGTQPPLQAGFAGIYKLLGLPVVPIAVRSGTIYHRLWKKPGTVVIRVGETVEAGLPRAEAEARVHAAINALND